MAYSVRVERVGKAGAPTGKAAQFEADTEIEAIAIAAYEVDISLSGPQRVATVFDATGQLIMAYTGRARDEAGVE